MESCATVRNRRAMPRINPDAFRLALGTTLRQRREQLGLSQEALALAVSRSPARISEMERGVFHVRMDGFLQACDALGVSPTLVFASAELMSLPTDPVQPPTDDGRTAASRAGTPPPRRRTRHSSA